MRIAVSICSFAWLALLVSCRPTGNAEELGTQTVEGTARMKFRAAVAKAYGAHPKRIEVRAHDLGIPQDHFVSRILSEIFAFRADFHDRALTVYGCNTAAPGDPAFIKHPDGSAALMKAARVLEEKNSLPAADLALLVAWIYQDFGAPVDPTAATLNRQDGRATLSYFTNSGAREIPPLSRKVTVTVQRDYRTTVTSEVVRPPQ